MLRYFSDLIALKNEKSAVTALEYSLVAALIAVVIITVVTTLGTDLGATLSAIAGHFSNGPMAK